MSIESTADRQAFMDAFGVSATVAGTSITAIWDNAYEEVVDTSTAIPMLTCMTTDVSGATYGAAVVVPSESFTGTVRTIEPDGTGITVLLLRKS